LNLWQPKLKLTSVLTFKTENYLVTSINRTVMSSLLVIGGSGFFGKSILSSYKRGLLAQWGISSIKVVSRHATCLPIKYPELNHRTITLHDLDASQCTSLPFADYVIHAAANVDATPYLKSPDQRETDIRAVMENYNRLAPIYHCNSKVLYVSSGAIYGASSDLAKRAEESQPIGTIETMGPLKRHYALAKLDAEAKMRQLAANGLNISIARCFAFAGEYLPRDGTFAFGSFIQDGFGNKPIIVTAKNKVYRTYMYADDLVYWLMTIAEASSPLCPIYNVGSDEVIELKELAIQMGRYFNVAVQTTPEVSNTADVYLPCIKKAQTELNLRITVPLDETIHKTAISIKRTSG
jgi:nucleoside-diphosphate-sugar epimerase